MKRNFLFSAVIAGVIGIAGLCNIAGAVNLNPDGLGQTFLYPDLPSSVQAVQNTDTVTVRYLESRHSREASAFVVHMPALALYEFEPRVHGSEFVYSNIAYQPYARIPDASNSLLRSFARPEHLNT